MRGYASNFALFQSCVPEKSCVLYRPHCPVTSGFVHLVQVYTYLPRRVGKLYQEEVLYSQCFSEHSRNRRLRWPLHSKLVLSLILIQLYHYVSRRRIGEPSRWLVCSRSNRGALRYFLTDPGTHQWFHDADQYDGKLVDFGQLVSKLGLWSVCDISPIFGGR
jgi:hypothetical protein